MHSKLLHTAFFQRMIGAHEKRAIPFSLFFIVHFIAHGFLLSVLYVTLYTTRELCQLQLSFVNMYLERF